MIDKERLAQILETMNVPDEKRDLNDKDNLSWLSQNLWEKNLKHSNFYEAIRLAKDLRDNNG